MRTISVVILLFLSLSAFAGQQTGQVDILYARAQDNLHLVTLKNASPKTNSPSCATNTYWLIKDENSVAGKSQFSQLLAAKMAQKNVSITGTNSCDRWNDGEDINIIIIQD